MRDYTIKIYIIHIIHAGLISVKILHRSSVIVPACRSTRDSNRYAAQLYFTILL